jgi:predicted amidophosphoribosyltransferase
MSWLGLGLVYTLIGVATAVPILLFLCAVGSRQSYRCPQCGEQLTTEYLKAKRCSMCGAPLSELEL